MSEESNWPEGEVYKHPKAESVLYCLWFLLLFVALYPLVEPGKALADTVFREEALIAARATAGQAASLRRSILLRIRRKAEEGRGYTAGARRQLDYRLRALSQAADTIGQIGRHLRTYSRRIDEGSVGYEIDMRSKQKVNRLLVEYDRVSRRVERIKQSLTGLRQKQELRYRADFEGTWNTTLGVFYVDQGDFGVVWADLVPAESEEGREILYDVIVVEGLVDGNVLQGSFRLGETVGTLRLEIGSTFDSLEGFLYTSNGSKTDIQGSRER